LINADTEESAHLVNSRMAYEAVSRGRYDAQIYTNDKSELAQHFSRDVSQPTAMELSDGHDHELTAAHPIGPSSVDRDQAPDDGIAPQAHTHSAADGQGQGMGE
jgi:hypothetical protein